MEDTNKLITVVTVTFNCEKLVEKTIRSVCSQTYPYIEYIIVDGLSTDKTLSIVRKYGTCVSILLSEQDNGIYDAMNKGIDLSSPKSSFITFLNAGDVFSSSNTVNDIFTSPISFTNHIYGNYSKAGKVYITPCKVNLLGLSTSMICHQAFFFRTKFHKEKKYDIEFKICSDYKFLLDLIYAGEKFHKIDRTIVDFDTSGVSCINRNDLHSERNVIRRMYPLVYFIFFIKKCYRFIRQKI